MAMKWFMFRIHGVKQSDGSYKYVSNFHETENTSPQPLTFENEGELRTVLEAIFATQKKERYLDLVLPNIKNEGHPWFGGLRRGETSEDELVLSEAQAKSLGWIKQQ